MRHRYVVCYDIRESKRLRRTFRILKGWGLHIQYSVFHCELNRRELVELKSDLSNVINLRDDQVLFVRLGPVGGPADNAIESLGAPYLPPSNSAVVE